MKIKDLFNRGNPVYSYELFPPRRDGDLEKLFDTVGELKALNPGYISITYGAGGSTQDLTFEIARRLKDAGVIPLVHFTCVGHGRDSISRQLDELAKLGIENILALRGDPPKGEEKFVKPDEGFGYANELISFIRSNWDFCLGVAAYPETHPEAQSADHDLQMLKQKVDAGADFINTQLFFDNEAFFSFCEKAQARGVQVPIIPGVMPVQSSKFFNRDWGASVPDKLRNGFSGDDAEADRKFGIGYASKQCQDLMKRGAPGIHLYTMNKAAAAIQIHQILQG